MTDPTPDHFLAELARQHRILCDCGHSMAFHGGHSLMGYVAGDCSCRKTAAEVEAQSALNEEGGPVMTRTHAPTVCRHPTTGEIRAREYFLPEAGWCFVAVDQEAWPGLRLGKCPRPGLGLEWIREPDRNVSSP